MGLGVTLTEIIFVWFRLFLAVQFGKVLESLFRWCWGLNPGSWVCTYCTTELHPQGQDIESFRKREMIHTISHRSWKFKLSKWELEVFLSLGWERVSGIWYLYCILLGPRAPYPQNMAPWLRSQGSRVGLSQVELKKLQGPDQVFLTSGPPVSHLSYSPGGNSENQNSSFLK